ncbi:MAG TPA: TRAP transporter substrate-binding protein DctP [Acetobacteraceae bacterium]|jgi:TRAP-type C4-dicarboxylate transport system substrate-binding protein
MFISRRTAIGGLLAAPVILRATSAQAMTRTLKISHQFPGGSAEKGDFRDRLVRRFAADVQERTKGSLAFEIYPNSSLMKTAAQFSALQHSALDLSLYPLAYAGGEVPEAGIGLMPALVTSYQQGMAWKTSEIGHELAELLGKRGVKILAWIWQAGGIASRSTGIVNPEDVKGLKMRGGSREVDLLLKAAGGIVFPVRSDDLYAAMQKGSLDAAITSSTSLINFRLQEISKNVTSGRKGSFWFMLEPLLMSRSVFHSLTPDQQKAVTDAGAAQEDFALAASRADDDALAEIYGEANVKVAEFTPDALAKWKAIAEDTAWVDFARRNRACAALLKLAEAAA